jgi:hypothetical protein
MDQIHFGRKKENSEIQCQSNVRRTKYIVEMKKEM